MGHSRLDDRFSLHNMETEYRIFTRTEIEIEIKNEKFWLNVQVQLAQLKKEDIVCKMFKSTRSNDDCRGRKNCIMRKLYRFV